MYRIGRRGTAWLCCAAAVGCVGFISPGARAETYAALALPAELRDLSIEQLTEVEVTSAAKRAEPLGETATAIYVISNDDIRRSGSTSVPEALRLAPNLQVQRINAREYAITARGFQGYETARHLLVLIDGRSVYSTLFSGVFWELRDLPLEDIDRIEVISGPGGTLYGPNAVNGVINIITRGARDTQGLMARGTASAGERTAALRYGGRLGNDGAFRIYANAHDRDNFPDGAGPDVNDGGEGLRAGFRADWASGIDNFTVQGDTFDNDSNVVEGTGENGSNLLVRWARQFGVGSSFQVQAYYDSFDRKFLLVSDKLEVLDLEAQHNWMSGRHQVVWGAGVRTTKDEFVNNLGGFGLDPQERRLWIGNVFAQDEIALRDDLSLTAGVKLEQTSFTGIEVLPNLRLAWKPAEGALLWSAVSRAIRTPSRIDRDLTFPSVLLAGTFESEELTAIEAGYRGQLSASSSLSVSLFYNIYDGLRTTEFASGGVLPVRLDNGLKGHTYGIEAWGNQQVASWWRLSAGVATLHKEFELKPGHSDIENGISLGNDPDFQAQLRSQMNLARNFEFDLLLRGVDSLPNPRVDGYVDLDVKLAWRPSETYELFVTGRNLLDERRDEGGDAERGQLIPRSVVAGARVVF